MSEPSSRAARVLFRLQLVVVATWVVFAVLNGSLGRVKSASTDVALVVLSLAFAAITYARPQWWRISMHATEMTSCVGLVVLSWWSGGSDAVAWWFLPAAPLFAAHVAGRREAWVWAILASLGAAAATTLSIGEVEFVPTPLDRATGGVSMVWVCASFGVLARSVADDQLTQIRSAAQARADLLATIGHEVRTPLHGMVGTASILAETQLAPQQREMIATIRSSGGALRKIVDDVLDVARLDAGRLGIDPHPVDLCTIVEDVVDLFAGDASTRGVALFAVAPASVTVEADGMRVRQILANLVGNAVKFTSSGHIAVRLEAHPEGAETRVSLSVEDTGPGVDVDELGALFSAFQQPDARLRRIHGGSGLGLSLSRHLAERMGGSLSADPDREVGARFVLDLTAPASDAVPSLRPPAGRCVVVEAEPVFAEAHLATAAALGVQMTVCESPEAAVTACREAPPQLVLVSDAPSLDVGAAAAALRAALGPALPIVHLIPAVQVGGELPYADLFHGTTLKPLRRGRLRALFDEARLTRDSAPTPTLVGNAVVLDDDPTSRRIITVMLERRGFAVFPLDNGEEALGLLRSEDVDVFLTDLNMPGQSGIEVVERATQLDSAKDTVFAVVSASTRPDDRRAALDAGAHAYLTKPFESSRVDELVARVARLRGTIAPPAPESPGAEPQASGPDRESLIDQVAYDQMRELLGDEQDELYEDLWRQGEIHLGTLRTGDETVELQRAAHTLASSTLQSGLKGVGERARALELRIKDMEPAAIQAEAATLTVLFEASFVAIGRPRKPPTPSVFDSPVARRSTAPAETDVAQLEFNGHLTAPMVQRELGRIARSGRPVRRLIVVCLTMTSYDPDARRAFEAWMKGIELDRIAIITRNRLWFAVVRAMSVATGRAMRAFRTIEEGRAWFSEDD